MNNNLKFEEDNEELELSSNFQKILNYLMDSRGISAAKLSKGTNIPPPTISRLLSGYTDDPKISTMLQLAKYFSVSLDQLMGLSPLDKNNIQAHTQESISLPIISWKESVSYKRILSSINEENWDNWILTEKPISEFSFGLKTKHHLEPRFPTGSILIVEPDLEVCEGDLVIVHYKNANETSIREVFFDGNKRKFLNINNSNLSDEECETSIIGVVVKTVFSYKEGKN